MVVCGYAKRVEIDELSEIFQRKVLKLVGGRKCSQMLNCGYAKQAETDYLAELFQLKVLKLVG